MTVLGTADVGVCANISMRAVAVAVAVHSSELVVVVVLVHRALELAG